MNANTQVAVIGCGAWGQNIVRNFFGLGHLYAVSDANPQTAVNIASQYNVHNYTIEQILNDPNINAVAVITPAETHYTIAKQVLESGKHVFVEKPLTMDGEQAAKLVKLANLKGLNLMTGHLLQYHPAFACLKQMVDSKQLGKLRYVYANRLSLGRIRSEENCIWDLAPHDFSMILRLINEEPLTVNTQGMAYQERGVLDTATTFLTFPSGIKAQVFVSWVHPFKEHKLVVVGDKGMAVFDDTMPWESKLTHYPLQTSPVPIVLEPAEPLMLECQHFINCIKNNTNPLTDGVEALKVVRALQLAQNSVDAPILEKQIA